MERHVAFVAVAEIHLGVLGPLIGLGQQHPSGRVRVHLGADALEDGVRLLEVLVVGSLALDQIGHRVEPQPVHAHVEPEAHDRQHFLDHGGLSKFRSG